MPYSHHDLPQVILEFIAKFIKNDSSIIQTLHVNGENRWGSDLKNWLPLVLDIWHTAFSELQINLERSYSAVNPDGLLEYAIFGEITGFHSGPLLLGGSGFVPLPASDLKVKMDFSTIIAIKDELIYRYFPIINWFAMLADTNLLKFVVNEKNEIMDYILSIKRAGHFS